LPADGRESRRGNSQVASFPAKPSTEFSPVSPGTSSIVFNLVKLGYDRTHMRIGWGGIAEAAVFRLARRASPTTQRPFIIRGGGKHMSVKLNRRIQAQAKSSDD
jgi:hypothetical protein